MGRVTKFIPETAVSMAASIPSRDWFAFANAPTHNGSSAPRAVRTKAADKASALDHSACLICCSLVVDLVYARQRATGMRSSRSAPRPAIRRLQTTH
jgi:hypothetical protein